MAFNNDVTIRRKNYTAAKEIKATAHYAYAVNGITLDGTAFDTAAFIPEGQCLGMDPASGKYKPWEDEQSYTNPVILDESIQFKVNDKGANPDVTAGQVLVHGAVYEKMLTGCTEAFKTALAGAIRFV